MRLLDLFVGEPSAARTAAVGLETLHGTQADSTRESSPDTEGLRRLAGWLLALHRCLGQDRITVGFGRAGSPAQTLQSDLEKSATVASWLQRVRASTKAATSQIAQPAATPGACDGLWWDGDLADHDRVDIAAAGWTVVVAAPGGEDIDLQAWFEPTHASRTGLTALLQSALRLAQGLAGPPHTSVHRLPMLSPGQRQMLLEDWNPRTPVNATASTVHATFEIQVERTPEAIALAWHGGACSYAALSVRARQFAEVLSQRGVVAGQVVGLALERGRS
ncbi:MAG: hypothetical protein ACKVQR_17010 [Aquabacterium sp.]